MSEVSADFASLLNRARDGDASALNEIVRRYEAELRLVAHVRLGRALRPYVDTVDLVQSVHKSLLRGLRSGRFDITRPEELIALALTMVRRKVARQWRRNKRQERGRDASDLAQQLASLGAAPDPAQTAQFDDAVVHMCRELNDTEKRLIELRLQGHSTAEAARMLGQDPDIVRVQLSRLRNRLREKGLLTEWL
jgi:RNA polymerase sigma-70 factor (ECF subfamily)